MKAWQAFLAVAVVALIMGHPVVCGALGAAAFTLACGFPFREDGRSQNW